jgi:hypothetical protein
MDAQPLQVGQRVALARVFLQAIGAPATDALWFQRGTVARVVNARTPWALVQWDHGGASRSLLCNLVAVDRLQFEER